MQQTQAAFFNLFYIIQCQKQIILIKEQLLVHFIPLGTGLSKFNFYCQTKEQRRLIRFLNRIVLCIRVSDPRNKNQSTPSV